MGMLGYTRECKGILDYTTVLNCIHGCTSNSSKLKQLKWSAVYISVRYTIMCHK